jgi:hypothetical protein
LNHTSSPGEKFEGDKGQIPGKSVSGGAVAFEKTLMEEYVWFM